MAVAVLLGGFLVWQRADAAVDVDPSFGVAGTATVSLGDGQEASRSVALDADGKIILAGWVDEGAVNEIGVVRLNADGSPDSTFNGDGRLRINPCAPGERLIGETSAGLAVQPDRKILVVVKCDDIVSQAVVALRLLPDGTPDPDFDGDGIIYLPALGTAPRHHGVAIQPNGRILMADGTGPGVIIRLLPSGALDTTFANNGVYTSGGYTSFNIVRTMTDGRIVAGGFAAAPYDIGDMNFYLVRLTGAGAADDSFGNSGVVNFGLGRPFIPPNQPAVLTWESIGDLDIRPDGAIVIAGFTKFGFGFEGTKTAILAQITAEGALDASWGAEGYVRPSTSSSSSSATAVVVRPTGDVFTTGVGILPAQISPDGLAMSNYPQPVKAWALALQPDQGVVAAVDEGAVAGDFVAQRFLFTNQAAPDTTPDAFAFASVAIAPLSTTLSASTVISGINRPVPVTVAAGEASVGCTNTWITAGQTATIDPGGSLCVRHVTSSASLTTTTTTVTVGGVAAAFSSTTGDAIPNAFSFVDQADVARSITVVSAPVTITGINVAVPVQLAGGEVSVNCTGTWSSVVSVSGGETICVRHMSAPTGDTTMSTSVTIGGVTDTFNSTTVASPASGGGGSFDIGLLVLLGLTVSAMAARRRCRGGCHN